MDAFERRLRQLEKQKAREEDAQRRRNSGFSPWVENAMQDPLIWTMLHTKTYNEHFEREGRPSPMEPFPQYEYFKHGFEIMDLARITLWEKSRDMMLTWLCVAYLERFAMTMPSCGILFQTQKEDKVAQLIKYAKTLWTNSDPRIREEIRLAKPMGQQSRYELLFDNGSYIIGRSATRRQTRARRRRPRRQSPAPGPTQPAKGNLYAPPFSIQGGVGDRDRGGPSSEA